MNETSQPNDWRSLCELASTERDPQKLMELVSKINRALEECHQRDRKPQASFKDDTVLPHGGAFDFYSFPEQRAFISDYDC